MFSLASSLSFCSADRVSVDNIRAILEARRQRFLWCAGPLLVRFVALHTTFVSALPHFPKFESII
jgi:hypothetical protein